MADLGSYEKLIELVKLGLIGEEEIRDFFFSSVDSIDQIDETVFSFFANHQTEMLKWLQDECHFDYQLTQDGMDKCRLEFADKSGAMDFKLRWFNV